MSLGTGPDSVNWAGAVFAAHGAELVNKEGEITVQSDAVKGVLEWFKRIVPFLPDSVFSWDEASNNKWLISGKGALIMNSPSAWAVAKRDAPKVAEQCWHFPAPAGPKGRFTPLMPSFHGVWNFSRNKSAAKSLLTFLWQRSSVEQIINAGQGYDIPAFVSLRDFKVWEDAGPPQGTLYNYLPRNDVIESVSGVPAPTNIANQIFAQATLTKLVARCTLQGQTIEQAVDWAGQELEGFTRN